MKKTIVLLFTLLLSIVSYAKIGYLLIDTETNNDCLECNAPWEGVQPENKEVSPERASVMWFNEHYVKADRSAENNYGEGQIIMNRDFLTTDLSEIDVLWIPIGRKIESEDQLKDLLTGDAKTKLIDFVKNGGNLFLSGFATYYVRHFERMTEDLTLIAYNNDYAGPDTWAVRLADAEPTHAVWKHLGDAQSQSDWRKYNLVSGIRNDRNCLWNGDSKDWNVFETTHNCKVLGYWGNEGTPNGAGFVEFYPTGDWKGTIIVNGLAAYQWKRDDFDDTTEKENVKLLTRGVLDYLNKRPESTWDSLEKTLIRIGGGFDNALSLQNPPSAEDYTIKYYSNDVSIANVLEDGMGVYGNYFGKVTFRAEMQGNGLTAPKNLWTIHSPELTVDGSAPAEFGYVLPYSLHTMSEYSGVNEEGYRPDFVSADWFNQEYVLDDCGCFINPKEYNAGNPIPDEVKVLWIHNDHVGLSSEDYFTDLGRENFVAALRAFVERGGHLFLSKQATRLVGDLHLLGQSDENNYAYPSYQNGGYSSDTSDPWSIKYDYTYDGNHKDYSTHPVYTGFTAYPQIQTNSKRTNNNFLLFENLDTYEDYQSKENEYKCRLLGCWANGQNPYQGGIFAEFLPRTAGNGTIIMMGAAAYHWTGFIVDDINGDLTNLTTNILAYLHGIDADTYVRPVTASRYGTICLPKASASITGAEIYRIIDQDTEGVVIEQVTTMEAGKPYFFYATSNTLTIKMQGERASLSPNNGLIGHADFEGKTLTIPQGSDKYILYDNMLYYVNSDVQLPCNYAYVDGSAITTLQAMPGMKRCIMATPGKGNAPTSLDNITNETVAPQKLMIDGKIYILRDGHIYSILGEHVK